MNSEYEVSSEIYEEHDYTCKSKAIVNNDNIVSRFVFTLKPEKTEPDEDGDLQVTRRKSVEKCIEIEHSKSTVLKLVGLQIWRGAFLLADWLIECADNFPKDCIILELAAGVGLTSVIASMYAKVYSTDVNRGELFRLIESNYKRNKHLCKHPLKVAEIDFMSSNLSREILAILPKVSYIIAADVVYDNELTKAFVNTVDLLLSVPPQRSIVIALEKRFVFTLADFDSVAPCYDYFVDCLKSLKNVTFEEIDCDFPQYFKYDRVKQLVLWKITSKF
ncbi:unnamed protein product [Brassicogethes aeneus]|uniref:Methyltransferase-like protein 22 n=1 Tax=Brassicogethes aeneus TaxID=1431903 RepID=A0A9P0AV17_BRAAE|nr:unnamed protein product [Brassicogethes aeneus]